jgi:glycine cleavage system H protein
MSVDKNTRFSKSHEWARKEGSELVIGISDHAQQSLGDIVFIDLPEVGTTFAAETSFGTIESVKAASDIYMPVAGKVTAKNGDLAEHPDNVNKDCYGAGWLVKLAPDKAADWDKLMNAEDYEKFAASES